MTFNTIFLRPDLGFYVVLILLGAILILRFAMSFQKKRMLAESKAQRKKMRQTGERITVMYDELDIKVRSWQQEVVVGSGVNSRNEYVQVNNNHIYLKKHHGPLYFEQEIIIDMAPEILRMKLALQTELSLYYNPKDPTDYFLDLEFLFE